MRSKRDATGLEHRGDQIVRLDATLHHCGDRVVRQLLVLSFDKLLVLSNNIGLPALANGAVEGLN